MEIRYTKPEHFNGIYADIKLSGSFLGDPETSDFESLVNEIIDEYMDGVPIVGVDVGKTQLISSSGVNQLITMTKKLRVNDGDLVLYNLNEKMYNVFTLICHLENILRIYNNLEDVINDVQE